MKRALGLRIGVCSVAWLAGGGPSTVSMSGVSFRCSLVCHAMSLACACGRGRWYVRRMPQRIHEHIQAGPRGVFNVLWNGAKPA